MLELLFNNKIIQVLIIFIVLDVIFGILASLKEHKINSTIGIDGIIRKIGMIFTITACVLLDYVVNIDLLSFIPEGIKEYINLGNVGTASFFAILYCLFEVLSIFKNMIRCKIPLPKKLQNLLKKLLEEFTNEIKEGERNDN